MFEKLAALLNIPLGSNTPGDSKPQRPDSSTPVTAEHEPVPMSRVQALYQRPPSFTGLLPWMDFSEEHQCVLLEDGVSVGAWLELTPVGCEARPEAFMAQLHESIKDTLTDSFPELSESPWVVQFFVHDDPALHALQRQVRGYATPRTQGTEFTEDYLQRLDDHLADIGRPGGLFVDTAITGGPWRGNRRQVFAAVYRRIPRAQHKAYRAALFGMETPPWEELNDVVEKFTSALQSAGVGVRRCKGRDLFNWLIRFFNPHPGITDGDVDALLEMIPYTGDDEGRPAGFDLSDGLIWSGLPRSDLESATWWFDDLPHRCITLQGLRKPPQIGHLTAERKGGDHIYALFDRLPENTVLSMTLVIRPQDEILNHIAQIKRASVGDSADAQLTGDDAEAAEFEIARGNKIYPLTTSFYLRGEDLPDLRQRSNQLYARLASSGMIPIPEGTDLLALDSFIRNLPNNYEPQVDKLSRRSRMTFTRDSASLLPLYGRSRGTGNPGFLFYNRGGEPFSFDPLHREDRKQNAHMLILGPTGAGKSAMLVYLIMQVLAIHRPRLFIIEAGNSFGLLCQHCSALGLSVNQVTLTPNSNVSLPPFADALQLLDEEIAAESALDEELESLDDEASDESEEGGRDILGEMEIAARIMITGGDERESARMTRPDRLMIREAILNAARNVRAAGRDQVLTEEVVEALREIGRDSSLPERKRERATDMGDSMALFCTGIEGKFFNRPGTRWPEADITHLEMGIFAREGYEDKLTVAYIGIMNHINDLVEREQHDDRPTIVITDEGHIITTNPLLAPYVVKLTKMWRKLGCWLWLATQNLEDFPDASKKMLNMMEWWLCLVMPKEEVEQIARFKALTEEQRTLLLSAHKEMGKYVEGVVLSNTVQALFRNVPPALALALAMTEKHEKAERMQIMLEHNCSELEAVYRVAARIAEARK
jgi:conjugative transfer ATPase